LLGPGAARWAQQLRGDGYPSAQDVAIDGGGNFIVAGSFDTKLSIGDTTLSGENDEAYVAKFSGEGVLAWAVAYHGPGIDAAHAVAVDAGDNIFVAGLFHDSLDLGGTVLKAKAGPDLFVAKLSPAGTVAWAKTFSGPGTAQVQDLAVDRAGDLVVVGFFDETLDVGGNALASAGMQDAFVAKLSAAGETLWAHSGGGVTTDSAEAVAINSKNDIVVTGYFRQQAAFGDAEVLSLGDKTDTLLATLRGTTGETVWAKRFGGTGYDAGYAVAVDDSDNLILGGTFDEAVLFGGGPLQPEGDFDVVLGKYDSGGNHIWSRRLGGEGNEAVAHIAVAGHVILVSGDFEGRARFGGEPLVSAGRHDGFIAKYSAAGAPIWARRFGGEGQDQLGAIAMSPEGDVAAVGGFHHAAELGDKKLETTGVYELVLFRLTP
jgi:hypothetical protein